MSAVLPGRQQGTEGGIVVPSVPCSVPSSTVHSLLVISQLAGSSSSGLQNPDVDSRWTCPGRARPLASSLCCAFARTELLYCAARSAAAVFAGPRLLGAPTRRAQPLLPSGQHSMRRFMDGSWRENNSICFGIQPRGWCNSASTTVLAAWEGGLLYTCPLTLLISRHWSAPCTGGVPCNRRFAAHSAEHAASIAW